MPKVFQLNYGSIVDFEKELLSDEKGMDKIFYSKILCSSHFP